MRYFPDFSGQENPVKKALSGGLSGRGSALPHRQAFGQQNAFTVALPVGVPAVQHTPAPGFQPGQPLGKGGLFGGAAFMAGIAVQA